MKDMIKKLVDIDEKAKSYSEETKKEQIRLEKEILTEKQALYSKYMEEAKEDAEKKKSELKKQAQVSFEKSEAGRKNAAERLQKQFDANRDAWVEQIVANVLS